jgi:hypothetical protein
MSAARRKKTPMPPPPRPKFTRQEYRTIVDALSVVKLTGEKSESFLERLGVRTLLPSTDYHIGIIDKLTANSDYDAPDA